MRNPVAVIFFALTLMPLTLYAQDFAPDETLVYKSVGEKDLKLHLFKPEGTKEGDMRPAIVFFFGGGWRSGTARQFYQQADFFAEKGIVCFSAEYRVKNRDKTTPFDAVEDAKSAIRWVRKHADELGVDPERIVASGGSAGGHIAGCTAVIEGLDREGEDLSVSSKPNAMMLYNPVLDTTEKGYGLLSVGEDRKTEISLTHHVRKGIDPTLLLHGTNDKTVPFENAERFAKLMKEAGNRCELEPFPGAGHGFYNSPFFRPNTKSPEAYEKAMEGSVQFLQSLGYME